MKVNKKNISDSIGKLINTGFFFVFGSTVINKIIAFASSILLVRILSKSEFGVYSYTLNIFSLLILFSGMGVANAILQMCCENYNNDKYALKIYQYGSSFGLRFNLLITIAIFLLSSFFPFPIKGCNSLLILFLLYPFLLLSVDLQKNRMRSLIQNKIYSIFNSLDTILLFVFSLAGALYGQAKGLILFRYFAEIIMVLIGIYIFKTPIYIRKQTIKLHDKIALKKIAIISVINNSLAELMYLLEVFILGLIIPNENVVASYKVATTIPTALNFIPLALMTYAYPYFAKMRNDMKWTKEKYKYLVIGLISINTIIVSFCYFLAPQIISTIYGEKYLDSVRPFKILLISYFIASVTRVIAGNLLVTQRKLLFNTCTCSMSAIVCGISNYFLITKFSTDGAAYAHLICMVLTGICNTVYYVLIINGKDINKGIFKTVD